MKLVVDTNIIFSALYNLESPAGKLLTMGIEKKIDLTSPMHVQGELIRALREKLGYSGSEIGETIAALPIDWIEADVYNHVLEEAKLAISHEEDAPIIACAMVLNCDVVSGDKHFHPLIKPVVKTWMLKSLKKIVLE